MTVIDTNSSRQKIKKQSQAKEKSLARSGVAILVDQRTGKRFVVESPPEKSSPVRQASHTLARLPKIGLPDIDLSGAGDIQTRKKRAYALLLLTFA